MNVYPVPPTSGVAGSAVPISIELAITVRTTGTGTALVLAGVPDDVNLPANVIVHSPMYPVNVTPLYVATPETALMTAFGDSTQAAGATVAVTVMASCIVTCVLPISHATVAKCYYEMRRVFVCLSVCRFEEIIVCFCALLLMIIRHYTCKGIL